MVRPHHIVKHTILVKDGITVKILDWGERIFYIEIMEENIKLKRKWGARKIISLVLFVIILSAVVYVGWAEYQIWWQERKIYVESGLASDKFPFRFYTDEELKTRGLIPLENQ